MKKILLLTGLFLAFLYSCEISPNDPNLKTLTAEDQKLVSGSNDFAYRLFSAISDNDKNENVFISPLSIGFALAMTYNGAAGETATEMQNLLGFENLAKEDVNLSYKNIYNMLLEMDKKVEFSLANSIWYKQELHVKKSFEETIKNYYSAEVKPVNTNDPNSKDIINKWVEDKTNKRIKDLVQEVKPTNVMFLINAIYFKAEWTYSFDKDDTYDGEFIREDNTRDACKMMSGEKMKIGYFADSLLTLAELPYGNKQFSMMILLPVKGLTVNDLIKKLNASYIASVRSKAVEQEMSIRLPKFKVEYDITLNEILKNMGMVKAFYNAEFPELFEEQEDYYISLVRHKSFIEVYEEGTESAAATVVVVDYKMANEGIVVNRPFVYMIVEKHTNTVLFMGKIMKMN